MMKPEQKAVFDILSAAYGIGGFGRQNPEDPFKGNKVIAVFGPSGSGKSKLLSFAPDYFAARGVESEIAPLDVFFRYDRQTRTGWKQDPIQKGDVPTYLERTLGYDAWNMDKAIDALWSLKAGEDVNLRGAYNRGDEGRMTLDDTLTAPKEDGVIFYDGAILSPLLMQQRRGVPLIDGVVMLYVLGGIRSSRFTNRSIKQDSDGEYAQEKTDEQLHFDLGDTEIRDRHELRRVYPAILDSPSRVLVFDCNADFAPRLLHPENGRYPVLDHLAAQEYNMLPATVQNLMGLYRGSASAK